MEKKFTKFVYKKIFVIASKGVQTHDLSVVNNI